MNNNCLLKSAFASDTLKLPMQIKVQLIALNTVFEMKVLAAHVFVLSLLLLNQLGL